MLKDVKIRDVTHVIFITKERVCLNWRVSPDYLRNVSSSLSMSVMARVFGLRIHTDGGCDGGCDSAKMTYWGGASPGSGKCACGMTNSCADSSYGCNCDKNDNVWREDSGLLTDKTKLPVKQLRFGDASTPEEGYHTLGKLKCFGIA